MTNNPLYSYNLSLEPDHRITMHVNYIKDYLIKKKLNHHVDIAFSIRELIEKLEEKKLNSIWFRKVLLKELQIKKSFSKEDEKFFNSHIDEFYLEYLLQVQKLIQDKKNEISEEDSNLFDKLFQIALDDSIIQTFDSDECQPEKAAESVIRIASQNNKSLKYQGIINSEQLEKLSERAKRNIAITSLIAIGKNLPSNNKQSSKKEEQNNFFTCCRLCSTIKSLNLDRLDIHEINSNDIKKAISFIENLNDESIKGFKKSISYLKN